MPIEKIEMTNFRNHKDMVLDFSPGINIIWGENGSGKTSILEAVYILSNGKSFKTNRLTETIKNGSTETTIRAHFKKTTTTLHQAVGSVKKIKTNNTPKTTKDLIGKNPTVLVSPEEEKITNGPHLERRKYFNRLYSNVSKTYLSNLIKYSSAIKNRNTLLKQRKTTKEIEIWNEPIAKYGSLIWLEKQELEKSFNTELVSVCKKYNKNIIITIDSNIPKNPTKENLIKNLQTSINRDVLTKRTNSGPHTDKYNISFNNNNLRVYGSQGEHKLSFVVIKISEHLFIKKQTGKNATLLLDDLFSKLDLERGNAIFDLIKESAQTIITNTDLVSVEKHGIDTNNPKNKTKHLERNWKN
tara:strand:+ start:1151 stop:2218 length:1068 start_codon:yes stop_codon:yes gene_type:complete